MTMWRRIVHWLTHDPTVERARLERARIESAIDALADRSNAELVTVVKLTLFHQGEPRDHVPRLLERLRRGESHGWDEADYAIEGSRVRVSLLDQHADADVAELITLLERIATVV